jgi:hypothetical protein
MNLYEIWQEAGGAFVRGLELLKKHCPNAVTPQIMTKLEMAQLSGAEPGPYLRGKISDALKKSQLKPDAAVVVDLDAEGEFIAAVKFSSTQEVPLKTVTTSNKAKDLHKRHGHLHATMATAQTDAARGAIAREIMEEVVPALDDEYDRLRGGDVEGSEAPPATAGSDSILRKLNSIRTRIARLRNKLIPAEKNDAKLAKLNAELAAKIAEKEALEAQI